MVALIDLYSKAIAAAVSLIFAAVVLSGGPRRPANQFLAGFLLLIAGNQGVETVREIFWRDPDLNLFHWRIATVFAALDPPVLYYFASIFPTRNALNDLRKVALAFCPGVLLAAAAVIAQGALAVWSVGIVLGAYTVVVYTIVLIHVLRALVARPDDRSLHVLFLGVSVVAVPKLGRTTLEYAFSIARPFDLDPVQAAALGVVAVLLPFSPLLLPRLLPKLPRLVRRRITNGLLLGTGLGTLIGFMDIVELIVLLAGEISGNGYELAPGTINLQVPATPLRWWLFGVFGSIAVLRHDMLGMSLTVRRLWARVLVALVFLAGALVVLILANSLMGRAGLPLRPTELLFLAAALAASQGFRRVVDRVAARVYGVPVPGDRAAALDAYRQGALQVAREGRSLATDPALARLREELSLDAPSARVIDGLVATAAAAPLTGGETVAGRYRIVRLLGRGGAGRAFLARDEALARDVVLKEVPDRGDAGEEAPLHEARVAGDLRHPNVVAVHDVLPRPHGVLLVLEYVPGGSLAEHLAREGPISAKEALRVADGILAGLEAVHAKGVVHCDLKPGNVLLANDGTPKIADFGIARVRRGVTVGFDERGPYGGTPGFMAPEQRVGALPTPATDVYAAGLLLRHIAQGPLPEGVARVVSRALEEEPARRFASAREMREALSEAAAKR